MDDTTARLPMCSMGDCERPVKSLRSGLCDQHYRKRLSESKPSCSVDGCLCPAKTRGWCQGHYMRWIACGDVRPGEPLKAHGGTRVRACLVEWCTEPYMAKGLCRSHYARQKRHGDVDGAMPIPTAQQPDCSVEGCSRERRVRGMCNMHYERLRHRGDVGPPERLMGIFGQGYVNQNGYRVAAGSGHALEHRVIMERIIGRELLPDETVHHVNGIRDDNRPENLELWSSRQPAGQRVIDKLSWAYEIIREYETMPQYIIMDR